MKLLIAGDFSPINEQQKIIEEGNMESLLKEMLSKTIDSDFSIVNFETVIKSPSSTKLKKRGPNLCVSTKSIEALKYAGFNVVTLANNHVLDYGEDCLRNTISELDSYGILHVGAGENLSDASIALTLDKNGQRVAIINCCEHEFSVATENSYGSNPLNPIHQFHEIQNAKKKHDYVIVIVHGGHELFQLPNLRMQETYRFFIDAGADVVINHHQHCYSGMEMYRNKPIFYGLGNFLFGKINENISSIWNYGFFVILDLKDGNIDYKIVPYSQDILGRGVTILKKTAEIEQFNNHFQDLSDIISNKTKLSAAIDKYYIQVRERDVLSDIEPYCNKYLMAAYRRKILPSFIRGKKLTRLVNVLDCESHFDIVRYVLKKRFYGN